MANRTKTGPRRAGNPQGRGASKGGRAKSLKLADLPTIEAMRDAARRFLVVAMAYDHGLLTSHELAEAITGHPYKGPGVSEGAKALQAGAPLSVHDAGVIAAVSDVVVSVDRLNRRLERQCRDDYVLGAFCEAVAEIYKGVKRGHLTRAEVREQLVRAWAVAGYPRKPLTVGQIDALALSSAKISELGGPEEAALDRTANVEQLKKRQARYVRKAAPAASILGWLGSDTPLDTDAAKAVVRQWVNETLIGQASVKSQPEVGRS